MITKTHPLKTPSTNALHVAFDIGKSALDLYFEIPHASGATFNATTGNIPNKPKNILATLEELNQLASLNGFTGLFVTCESTGAYSDKLLRLARQHGHLTAYVSGEAVHKLKVVENNDAGKTDTKDPRVILMLSKMDKILRHRPLTGPYLALRELNRSYEEERRQMTSLKCQFHPILIRLFCDLNFSSQFLYEVTGKALYKFYRYNPYKIIAQGKTQFEKTMRKNARGIHTATLERLWTNAQTSSLLVLEAAYIESMEYRLEGLWERMLLAERRLKEITIKMIEIYHQLANEGEKVPEVSPGFLSAFRIARILGETGPLSDFPNADTLMKFAGLNLRERKSGQYTGGVHLSKKGRSTLRGVLGESVFGMVKKQAAFGSYYHEKKRKGMAGTKIMAIVERKLLRVFYSLGIKSSTFDKSRLNQCESQIRKAA
jgi:transposase